MTPSVMVVPVRFASSANPSAPGTSGRYQGAQVSVCEALTIAVALVLMVLAHILANEDDTSHV